MVYNELYLYRRTIRNKGDRDELFTAKTAKGTDPKRQKQKYP